MLLSLVYRLLKCLFGLLAVLAVAGCHLLLVPGAECRDSAFIPTVR